MDEFWTNCTEAVRFACEANAVISARFLLFASGAPSAAAEADRMIAEKVLAFADAQAAAERALEDGLGFHAAIGRAFVPLRERVHANSERLLNPKAPI